eukprot:1250506-Prymnesium_polylepis.1
MQLLCYEPTGFTATGPLRPGTWHAGKSCELVMASRCGGGTSARSPVRPRCAWLLGARWALMADGGEAGGPHLCTAHSVRVRASQVPLVTCK